MMDTTSSTALMGADRADVPGPRFVRDVVCPATVLAQGRVGESAQVARFYPTGFGSSRSPSISACRLPAPPNEASGG